MLRDRLRAPAEVAPDHEALDSDQFVDLRHDRRAVCIGVEVFVT
ncbi:MAG: hypothetical protein SGJ11_16400 [Phycisphaerae bacterium]|nr:hypothetical protein [Phycisphaerae bacterium]